MKRLSIAAALIASLTIAGTALAAKPALEASLRLTTTATYRILSPTGISVDIVDGGQVIITDSTWSSTNASIGGVDVGFNVKSGSSADTALLFGLRWANPYGDPSTSRAVIEGGGCDGRVSTENPTCEVWIFSGPVTGTFANWDELVATYPDAVFSQQVAAQVRSDATLSGIDLR